MEKEYGKAGKILISLILILIILPCGNARAEKISIREAEEIVLSENPGLKAAGREVMARELAVTSSAALDDPKIKLGVNNLPAADPNFKDSDMTTKEIGVAQMFPLGGKLSSRKAIAEIDYNIAKQMYRKEKIDAVTSLRVNSCELAFVRESIRINEEIKDQIKLLVSIQTAANRAGTGTLDAVVKTNLEYSMVEEEIIILNQKEKELLEALSYLAGRKIDIITDNPESGMKEQDIVFPGDDILKNNPDLAISRLEADKSRYEASLTKKDYIPDAELGLSYMQRDNGPMGKRDDMVSGMVTFNLPVWIPNKNKPKVDEKNAGRERSEYLVKDKINFLLYRAGVISSEIQKWQKVYLLYRDQLIPQGELAFQTSLAAYKTGRAEFMSVIDTLRMLLRYKKERLMALKEYHVNTAELNALAGTEFTE